MADAARADQDRSEVVVALKENLRDLQSGKVKVSSVQQMITQVEQQIRELEQMMKRDATGERNPVPAFVHLSLGATHFRMGHLDAAEDAFRQALAGDAGLAEAHNNLAVVYMLNRRYQEAEREVAAAEKAGFAVNPKFKEDLAARKSAAAPR